MAQNNVQTLEKGLKLLMLLGERRMTFTQLCEASGYHKSTVHRLLHTLSDHKFIRKDPQSGAYEIGLKLVELSSMQLNKLELKTEAAPYLRQLARYAGHAVHLGIRDGMDVVYIEKIEPINTLRMFSEIGRRVPLYSTALGKCLLTPFSDEEIEDMFRGIVLEARTSHTITAVESLLKDIARAREVGFAIDEEENETGIYCVAAPIYDYRGMAIAALSISADDSRLMSRPEIPERVRETAASVSGVMGWKGQ